MTDDEIIKYFTKKDRIRHVEKKNKFKDNSVKELCLFMSFFERNFKTDKGNWSIKKLIEFKGKKNINNDYEFEYNIFRFYAQYQKRKKDDKKFLDFLGRVKNKKIQFKYGNSLELIDKKNIKDFLGDLKILKHKYLKGDDKELLSMIEMCIKTGYSKSTLRNYYYKN